MAWFLHTWEMEETLVAILLDGMCVGKPESRALHFIPKSFLLV